MFVDKLLKSLDRKRIRQAEQRLIRVSYPAHDCGGDPIGRENHARTSIYKARIACAMIGAGIALSGAVFASDRATIGLVLLLAFGFAVSAEILGRWLFYAARARSELWRGLRPVELLTGVVCARLDYYSAMQY